MRAFLLVLPVALLGCHGTDLRVGTGHTFADGGSSGSASGKHGTRASYDIDTEDTSSVWVELGFQLTPQTVIVRHADDHGDRSLEPLYPPESFWPTILPAVHCAPVAGSVTSPVTPVTNSVTPNGTDIPESSSIDWEEVLVAVLLALIPIFFGGRAVVRRVKRNRR